MKIESLEPIHYEGVSIVYELGIASGNATFQTSAPSWKAWDESHLKSCRLIALDQSRVVGWAALSPVSDRCAYAGVAEVSVYVHPAYHGKGIGKELLKALIHESEEQNVWTLQAGIFPENEASLKIHQQLGFRQIGYREKIGQLRGVWRDTILLERRSQKVGV